jgi:hypothetical protein
MSLCAGLSEPDHKAVGRDLACIAFTDQLLNEAISKVGLALLPPWYISFAILSSRKRRALF